jgi:putative FmdB family regulatory protein
MGVATIDYDAKGVLPMPLFEFACKACDHEFEALVRGADAPECPSCRSQALERRQSVFAARTAGTASISELPVGGGCGRCGDPRGPGACSIN